MKLLSAHASKDKPDVTQPPVMEANESHGLPPVDAAHAPSSAELRKELAELKGEFQDDSGHGAAEPAPVAADAARDAQDNSGAAGDEGVLFGEPDTTNQVELKRLERYIPWLKVGAVIAVVGMVVWAGAVLIQRVGRKPVNSYQTCVQAGNPVQESYPPVCVDAKTGNKYDAFSGRANGQTAD